MCLHRFQTSLSQMDYMASNATIIKVTDTSGKTITQITTGNKMRVYFKATSKTYSYRARIVLDGQIIDGTTKTGLTVGTTYYLETPAVPVSWLGTALSKKINVNLVTYNSDGVRQGRDTTEITLYNSSGGTSTNPPTSIEEPTIEYVSAGNAAVDSWNQSSSDPIFVKGFSKGKFTFTGNFSGWSRVEPSIPNLGNTPTITASSAIFTTETFTVSGTQDSSITFYFGSASYRILIKGTVL